MAEITITRLKNPSQSKQAGPCWIGLAMSEDSGLTFANPEPQTVEVKEGQVLTAVGKAALKKQRGGTTKDGQKKSLIATGNPDDVLIMTVGGGQWVQAEITGVREQA
jgi:hypothetical protein